MVEGVAFLTSPRLTSARRERGGTPRPGLVAAVAAAARSVATSAVTPLVPSDYLDLVAPLRSGPDLRARVPAVTRETRDAVTVHLRPGGDWAGHVPGQYVRIGVDVEGVRHWRAYSLTSPVDAPGGLIS